MQKLLMALPLALLSIPQVATTVHLKTTPCTATRICYSVQTDGTNPNGTPLVIDSISASATYGRVTLSMNGVLWDSGLYAVVPMSTSFNKVLLHDGAGNSIALSASYTHWVTLNHSGHNYYVQHWRLDNGTLYLP